MSQTKTDPSQFPVEEASVVAFPSQVNEKSPLDELIQEGARRMLQSAIDAEVEAFIQKHDEKRDENGRRLVVKNGSLPEREILTGAGAIPVKQGRVRDNKKDPEKRVVFFAECSAGVPAEDRGHRRTDSVALLEGNLHKRFR